MVSFFTHTLPVFKPFHASLKRELSSKKQNLVTSPFKKRTHFPVNEPLVQLLLAASREVTVPKESSTAAREGFCRKLAAIRREYCSIVAGKKVSSLEGCLLEGTKLEVVEMSLKIRGSSSKRRSAQ